MSKFVDSDNTLYTYERGSSQEKNALVTSSCFTQYTLSNLLIFVNLITELAFENLLIINEAHIHV